MVNEIERKFLVREMPIDISKQAPKVYERFYLEVAPDFEDRIQMVDDRYYREKKRRVSDLERTKEKEEISKEEFERLKQDAGNAILRESFFVSQEPEISIKVYKGRFEPLVRAEVEFETEVEAKKFIPLYWMGKEITDSPLGKDSKLILLSDLEFKELLNNEMSR